MVLAAGLFLLAGTSRALNMTLFVRQRPLERLPLFSGTTSGWRWYQWLLQTCTVGFGVMGLVRASHHIGYLLALAAEGVAILGPAVAVTAVHNHRLGTSAPGLTRGPLGSGTALIDRSDRPH